MIDWGILLEKSILILAVVTVSLVIAMYATWAERKIAAVIQDRLGPNRAGPFGLLQPVADGLKLFMKEEIIPSASSKFLFIAGPALAMVTALRFKVLPLLTIRMRTALLPLTVRWAEFDAPSIVTSSCCRQAG